MKVKKITRIIHGADRHWVGDGFPVNTMFSYDTQGKEISPFLLLDYAGPANFEPSDKPRGVEQHPHRGFETVTIVYQGEIQHSDNAGNSGKIGPGDVQWMTAARGILHEEMHSREFTSNGGTLEMIQLWVNLPAKDKMSEPHYQEIISEDIPVIGLPDDAGTLRLIAGEHGHAQGAAKTFTPINVWDMRLKSGYKTDLAVPEGHNTSLLVLSGKVIVNGEKPLGAKELVLLEREGDTVSLETQEDSVALLMSGEPIDEPIVGRGPFVMNTEGEIRTAMADYAAGRF
jgi:redox-sensitive bicupin YhaK (pirin superfamily)